MGGGHRTVRLVRLVVGMLEVMLLQEEGKETQQQEQQQEQQQQQQPPPVCLRVTCSLHAMPQDLRGGEYHTGMPVLPVQGSCDVLRTLSCVAR